MRGSTIGRILFAVSFAVLGALSIALPDFAKTWPLIPKATPYHDVLAVLAGTVLLVSSLGLFAPRLARLSALVLTALLAFLLLQQIPGVLTQPLVEASWYSVSENLVFVAGGWTIFSSFPRASFGQVRLGQILFALALPAIGLSHMFYLDQTAPLIPAWLPFHVALAYFTGVAHIAAGLGILFGVLPRLAATLEGDHGQPVHPAYLGADGHRRTDQSFQSVRDLRVDGDHWGRLGSGRVVSRRAMDVETPPIIRN